MNAPVNLYAAMIFDLPPKVADYIKGLDKAGQIDRDQHQQPYLLKVERQGSNFQCFIIRNGVIQNFILNTRKKRDPERTWDDADGYQRADAAQARVIAQPAAAGPRGERAKRVETWDRLVSQILKG